MKCFWFAWFSFTNFISYRFIIAYFVIFLIRRREVALILRKYALRWNVALYGGCIYLLKLIPVGNVQFNLICKSSQAYPIVQYVQGDSKVLIHFSGILTEYFFLTGNTTKCYPKNNESLFFLLVFVEWSMKSCGKTLPKI